MVAVVSQDSAGPAALAIADSSAWLTETVRIRAPTWKNEVTLRSIEALPAYDPVSCIGHISPTRLLMVIALGDYLSVADDALAAYERALFPKQLEMLNGGHFDAYGADFGRSSAAATNWFVQHPGDVRHERDEIRAA